MSEQHNLKNAGNGGSAGNTDAEINAVIAEQKKRINKGTIIIIIGILFLLGVVFTMNPILIILAVIVIGIGFRFHSSAADAIKAGMVKPVLMPALESVFDHVVYRPEDHIPDHIIKNTDMGFGFTIDKIYGSDYIKAEYQGVGVEMSDIQLVTIEETEDKDGNITETEYTRFRGMWLICDFHKRFSADLLLWEQENRLGMPSRKSVRTDNDAFNKKFCIQSDSDHDVFYVLTPHMMEYILSMDKAADGHTHMRFLKEGKIILALDTGRDIFEINQINTVSAESLQAQFVNEMRYVTNLIDELKLVKTLHEKP